MSSQIETSDDVKQRACQTSWNALAKEQPEKAAEILAPYVSLTLEDEEIARVWCAMMGFVDDAGHLDRELRRLAIRWAAHGEIVLEMGRAIARYWNRQPGPLKPADREGLIGLGVDLIEHCLSEAPPTQPRERALLFVQRAYLLSWAGPQGDDQALQDLEVALTLVPDLTEGWFRLARLHLSRGKWGKAAVASQEGLERGGDPQRLGWNLAVALTGLGNNDLDLNLSLPEAWSLAGHEELAEMGVEDSDGRLIAKGFDRQLVALTSYMVNLGGGWDLERTWESEVVWVQPLSPCHGRILHPTAGKFPADFDDVVIWDPQPTRFTVFEGEERAVMKAIAILSLGAAISRPCLKPRLTKKQRDRLNQRLPQGVLFHQAEDGEELTGKLCWPRGAIASQVVDEFKQLWAELELP